MNTETDRQRRFSPRAWALAALGCGGLLAAAAVIASGALPSKVKTAVAKPAAVALPDSDHHGLAAHVTPLAERQDVVAWDVLAKVKSSVEDNRLVAEFPPDVRKLDKQSVKIQGYMLPSESGEARTKFLLSSVATTCPHCIPTGREGLVEVRINKPVAYTPHPVVVEGRLAVLYEAKEGLYYRIADGTIAR